MIEIPPPLQWEQRSNSANPLPGGYSGYLASLRIICEHIEQGGGSLEEIVEWARSRFAVSENSSRLRMGFLRKAGLIHLTSGIVSVDERIQASFENDNNYIPIAVIHSRVKFIGEMLNELVEPKSKEELRKKAADYGLDWQKLTQIDNRHGWLGSAKLIEAIDGRLNLTKTGRTLLEQLEVHVPSAVTTDPCKLADGSDPAGQVSTFGRHPFPLMPSSKLANEILEASTDSKDPTRFERAVRDAFRLLGFAAEHLGGSGKTDVLLTAPLGKHDSYRVAVDAKTTASGFLSDNQVDWATLQEHRTAHNTKYSMLVAPNPSARRLVERAGKFKVALLSAEQLANLCADTPLSLVDYEALFATLGEVDLSAIDEAADHLKDLRELAAELCKLLPEKTDRFGRMSARDIMLLLGKEGEGISQSEIESLLDMLAHPLIGAVYRFDSNTVGQPTCGYVLATSREVSKQRIEMLGKQLGGSGNSSE